jgi:hypothetical protein
MRARALVCIIVRALTIVLSPAVKRDAVAQGAEPNQQMKSSPIELVHDAPSVPAILMRRRVVRALWLGYPERPENAVAFAQ